MKGHKFKGEVRTNNEPSFQEHLGLPLPGNKPPPNLGSEQQVPQTLLLLLLLSRFSRVQLCATP